MLFIPESVPLFVGKIVPFERLVPMVPVCPLRLAELVLEVKEPVPVEETLPEAEAPLDDGL